MMLSVMTTSVNYAAFGIYLPKYTGSIYEVMSAPISAFEIIIVYVGAAATKSILISLLIAITTLAYLFKHGFKASYFTDKLQSYGIVFLLVIVFTTWFSQNSPSQIISYANAGGLNSFETFSLKSALAVIIAVTAAEVFSMGYWKRTFSAENSEVIKKASIFSVLRRLTISF